MVNNGLHHIHKRKRVHQKLEKYPHPDKWKNLMDKIIYVVAIFGPIMTIPQVMKIWVEQNPTGVSVISWSAYLLAAIFWLMYGVLHKEKPIIFTNILMIILEAFILVGILIYR